VEVKKLTYSGTKCNNYLYFAFYGDEFNLERITAELNIKPTSVRIKKDLIPKSTSWNFQISVGEEIDLETPLGELIDIFEPKIKEINLLKEKYKLETRLQFVMDIDINPEASTPYFGLNKRIINFLNQTETEVDYDLYKADTIGVIKD
jgi:Domain of unknown function (DUF4279)